MDAWWCVTAETEAALNVISAGLIAVFRARPMQREDSFTPHVQSGAGLFGVLDGGVRVRAEDNTSVGVARR